MKKKLVKSFLFFLLFVIGNLVWLSGCCAEQEAQEENPGKWEPGVSQFSHNETTYSVVKQFLDEDTALTLVVGDQGVSIALAHLSSGMTSLTYIPHDGGDISRHETLDLPLEDLYQEAKESAGYPAEK